MRVPLGFDLLLVVDFLGKTLLRYLALAFRRTTRVRVHLAGVMQYRLVLVHVNILACIASC